MCAAKGMDDAGSPRKRLRLKQKGFLDDDENQEVLHLQRCLIGKPCPLRGQDEPNSAGRVSQSIVVRQIPIQSATTILCSRSREDSSVPSASTTASAALFTMSSTSAPRGKT